MIRSKLLGNSCPLWQSGGDCRRVAVTLIGGLMLLACTAVAGAADVVTVAAEVVTASRSDGTLMDLPANVTVLTLDEMRYSAAITADDMLRQIPGFRLFRRSSSHVAHPTAQGVSLRGVGASGASRTLVMLDGMPLNDAFGGWVQWNKVPVERLERIEVLRGGGAHLWGNYALGGVIHLRTAMPRSRRRQDVVVIGDHATRALHVGSGDRLGSTTWNVDGSFFQTEGYPVVRADQRGAIDVAARSENFNLMGRLRRTGTSGTEIDLQGGLFFEERGNGTPLTGNATDAAYVAANWRRSPGPIGQSTFSVFAQAQGFSSKFASPDTARRTELPALDQYDVPSQAFGFSAAWINAAGARHLLSAGADLRWVGGETNEQYLHRNGKFNRRRQAGGDQHVGGIYFQNVYVPDGRLRLTMGVRMDGWYSYGAWRRERNLETGDLMRDDNYGRRTAWLIGPKVGLSYVLGEGTSLRGSLYRNFRTPTPNELFRPFRVGKDITEANQALDPERLRGLDLGIDHLSGWFKSRVTWFWNQIDNPIANVTVASDIPEAGMIKPCGFVPAGGTCRQRANLVTARSWGLEAEVGWYAATWSVSQSYILNFSQFIKAPKQPGLEGMRLPQIPEQDLVLQLRYAITSQLRMSVQWRYSGLQYEDDRNIRDLAAFHVLDLMLVHKLGADTEVFLQAENLLDETYATGRRGNGLVTTGAPRLLRGGVRFGLY